MRLDPRALVLLALPLLAMACDLKGLPADKLIIDDSDDDSALDDSEDDSEEDTEDDTGDDTADDTADDTSPPDPVDDDHDGFTVDEDCDDTNASVHPGADDVLNGVDDDCDGVIDEVNVCQDGVAEYGSIQAAIDATPEGRVIEICPGEYFEVLVLNKSLTLWAPGGPETTNVDSDYAGVSLSISGVRAGPVTVDGLRLEDGISTDWGATIRCLNSTLVLRNVILEESEAPSGAGLGAQNCVVDIDSSIFRDNTATASDGNGLGGGVYLYSCSGSFTNNEVLGNHGANGAGMYVYDDPGALTIDGNLFQGNHSSVPEGAETSFGGGIYLYGDSPITNNVFDGNASDDDGGAGYISYGSGLISGNVVSNNTCGNDGAGFYISRGTHTISDNTFEANASSDDAGGLRIYVSRTTIENNTFIGNTANDDGGGLKLSHYTNTIRGNYFEGNTAGDAGGGLEFDNETSTLQDCVFVGNTAARGGGVHAWRNEGSSAVIETSEFYGNHATTCGGAIELDNLTYNITLRHLDIHDNTGVDGAGVCVDVWYWDSDDDGVRDTWRSARVTLTNSLIYDNVASDDAGALYVKAGSVTATNLTMDGNSGPDGAAVVAKYDTTYEATASITLMNSIVSNSSGSAALLVDNATITASYSDFFGNTGGNVSGLSEVVGSSNNLGVDPLFTDRAGKDFHLQATSPAVNAGNPSSTYYDPDRSRNDMGAFGGPLGSW